MRLRRGDCGHWIPESVNSVATTHDDFTGEREVYLCSACLELARVQQAPKVEQKAVAPEPAKGLRRPGGH